MAFGVQEFAVVLAWREGMINAGMVAFRGYQTDVEAPVVGNHIVDFFHIFGEHLQDFFCWYPLIFSQGSVYAVNIVVYISDFEARRLDDIVVVVEAFPLGIVYSPGYLHHSYPVLVLPFYVLNIESCLNMAWPVLGVSAAFTIEYQE
ncbi:MAG: hypothetical protein OXC03_10455 [Flavobacteriaceae bacterium]|nr:hypothetical protein [Flavobacteriaceae bacterium]